MKRIVTATISLFLMAAITFPSIAANHINSISVGVREEKTDPGTVYTAELYVNGQAEIVDYEVSTSYENWKAGRKVTYNVTLEPKEGYQFNKKKTKVYKNGSHVELISHSLTSNTAHIRINYWPSMQLAAPMNLYLDNEYLVKWDEVENCRKYEVAIYTDGRKKATKEVTKTEFDLTDFATEDGETTLKVRALPKNSEESKYLKASDWTDLNDATSANENNTSLGSFSGKEDHLRFRNSEGQYVSGWQLINGSWYYFKPTNNNYAAINRWENINDQWYLFNQYGIMQTGWVQSNGYWYYLSTSNDGTYGRMTTGWLKPGPGCPNYYLNAGENQTIPYGAMYANTMTPDGHYVDESGACYDVF